jgi:hypothetical protein
MLEFRSELASDGGVGYRYGSDSGARWASRHARLYMLTLLSILERPFFSSGLHVRPIYAHISTSMLYAELITIYSFILGSRRAMHTYHSLRIHVVLGEPSHCL